ncbi:MAG: hypothetical protein Q4C05_04095 [Akkermansia sp.]|nr:hypothetical protein [Akkermansia sp.]
MPDFIYYIFIPLSLFCFLYILRIGSSPSPQYKNESPYLRRACLTLIPLALISFPLWLIADNTPYATPTFILFILTTPLALIHLCIRIHLIQKNDDMDNE